MAVAFDAVGPGANGSSVSSISWTHTPVGTPTAVGVWVCGYFASALGAATYGGTTMSAGTRYGALGSANAQSYGLANPAAGAKTVVVNGTAAYIAANSISVTGSDTLTCFSNRSGNAAFEAGPGGSSTASVTSTVGELVVDIVVGFSSTAAPSGAGAGQTSRATDFWNGNLNLGISTQAGAAGTVTSTWSNIKLASGGQAYAAAIDSFKAAPPPAIVGGTLLTMGVG